MPRIHAPELDGAIAWINSDGPLRMADLRGQVVILDFWTYCCINCMHVLPTLRGLEERHKNDPLVVIGVHSAKFNGEKDPARIGEAVARYEVHHPVAVDSGMRIWSAYAVRSWPTLVIVRPDGTIAAVAPGEPDPEMLSGFVQKLLDEARADGTLAKKPIAISAAAHVDSRALFFPGKAVACWDGRIAVADSGHHRILITDKSGQVLHAVGGGRGFADGDFASARFDDPQGLSWEADDAVWVADTRNHAIRRIDLEKLTVTTMAGTGKLGTGRPPTEHAPALEVDLRSPWDVHYDGDPVYVAMAGSHQLWTYDVEDKTVGPFAGSGAESLDDGILAEATFAQPSGLAIDGKRNILYVADSETSAVRAVDLMRGQVKTLVGEGLFDFGDVDGPAARARLQHCLGVAFANNDVIVADTYNNKLKRVGDEVKTIYAARGPLALDEPGGISVLPDGRLLVADTNHHRLLAIAADGSSAEEIAITGAPAVGQSPSLREVAGAPAGAPGKSDGWFTTVLELPDEAALAPGNARVVLDLAAPSGTEIAAGSPIEIAVEVSRRSDLLLLAAAHRREEAAGGASARVEIACEVRALPSDTVESELVATLDFVVCDPATHACTPGRSMLRIPVRLGKRGANTLTFAVPLPKS
jgi:DNA-binding beta-propeller fold protein YncE